MPFLKYRMANLWFKGAVLRPLRNPKNQLYYRGAFKTTGGGGGGKPPLTPRNSTTARNPSEKHFKGRGAVREPK